MWTHRYTHSIDNHSNSKVTHSNKKGYHYFFLQQVINQTLTTAGKQQHQQPAQQHVQLAVPATQAQLAAAQGTHAQTVQLTAPTVTIGATGQLQVHLHWAKAKTTTEGVNWWLPLVRERSHNRNSARFFTLKYRSVILSTMGDKPIQPVIQPVSIDTMLNWITDIFKLSIGRNFVLCEQTLKLSLNFVTILCEQHIKFGQNTFESDAVFVEFKQTLRTNHTATSFSLSHFLNDLFDHPCKLWCYWWHNMRSFYSRNWKPLLGRGCSFTMVAMEAWPVFLTFAFFVAVGGIGIDTCQHERNNGATTVATTTATPSCATAAASSYHAATAEGSPFWEPKVSIFFFSTINLP